MSTRPSGSSTYDRRNATALVVGRVSSSIGMHFAGVSSVIPAFARHLTSSAPLIGLIGTVYYAGLLLPEALFARLIAPWPRKKPFASAAHAGRLVLFVIAAALLTGLASYPARMLALLIACLALWALGEGAGTVGWMDIVGRALPSEARARLYGLSHAAAAVAGIGVGAFITWALSRPALAFPTDYALIFALAGLFLVVGTLGLMTMREPGQTTSSEGRAKAEDRGALARVMGDQGFRRMLVCRLAVAAMDLATPFYVLHATDTMGLPESTVGVFTVALTAATVIASLVYTRLGARRGPHVIIRIAAAAAVFSPLYALAAHVTASPALAAAYPLVYAGLGVVSSAYLAGFGNYLLDLAPDGLHGAYIGLGNSFLGIQAFAPLVGGWLLGATSYTVLFGLSAGGAIAGLVLAMRLPQAVRAQPTGS